MNILYTTNDQFVGKVGAGICSVFENNKDMEQIHIFIAGQEITKENCEKFQKLADNYQREITILELGDLQEYLDFSFDTNGWNPIVLARLLLDRYLPEDVERILYLDGDTIVIDSLRELWTMDMKGCVLGGCIEATVNKKQKKDLEMENLPYINAGVLLIDLKKWRLEQVGTRILEYYRIHDGNLFANDQDAINGCLKENICYLPPRYNFYNIYWFYSYKILKKLMGNAWYYAEEIYQESIAHPAIIHYLGEERPWRKGNRHKFKEQYKQYHDMTEWRREEEEEGWEMYYICWGIFNFLMNPFPMIRYKIINGLIPTFMKWRKKQLVKERK